MIAPQTTTSPAAASELPLSRLSERSMGVITRVEGEGPQAVRLKQLGLCRGRCVLLLRDRDPLVLEVMGSRLGLARSLAERVFVTPCQRA